MEAALERFADKGNSKLTLSIQTREVFYVRANECKYLSPNELMTSIRRHGTFLNVFQIRLRLHFID